MPITWCLVDPKIGQREICLDLLTIAVETGLLGPGQHGNLSGVVQEDPSAGGRQSQMIFKVG